MATFKIASLAVRTLAKPVSNYLKSQAMQHDAFKEICISIAQRAHRTEAKMRMSIAGEKGVAIKPLNDTRAIQNGANTLAESFLFLVAAGLIIGEGWRSSNNASKRRDNVDDKLQSLQEGMEELQRKWEDEDGELKRRAEELDARAQQLTNIISTILHHHMGNPFGVTETAQTATVMPSSSQSPSSSSIKPGSTSAHTLPDYFSPSFSGLQAHFQASKTVDGPNGRTAQIPVLSLLDWDEESQKASSKENDTGLPSTRMISTAEPISSPEVRGGSLLIDGSERKKSKVSETMDDMIHQTKEGRRAAALPGKSDGTVPGSEAA